MYFCGKEYNVIGPEWYEKECNSEICDGGAPDGSCRRGVRTGEG